MSTLNFVSIGYLGLTIIRLKVTKTNLLQTTYCNKHKKYRPNCFEHGFDPQPPKWTMFLTKQIFFMEVLPKHNPTGCL